MQTNVAAKQMTQKKYNAVNKNKRDKYIMDYLPLVKYVVGEVYDVSTVSH